MSRQNRPALSLARITRQMKNRGDKTVVVVGTVTDDKRIFEVSKLLINGVKFLVSSSCIPRLQVDIAFPKRYVGIVGFLQDSFKVPDFIKLTFLGTQTESVCPEGH